MNNIQSDFDTKYANEVRARMAQQATQRASITASGANTPTGSPLRTAGVAPIAPAAPSPEVLATRAADGVRVPTPVAPTPVAPTPVAPTPVAPTAAAPQSRMSQLGGALRNIFTKAPTPPLAGAPPPASLASQAGGLLRSGGSQILGGLGTAAKALAKVATPIGLVAGAAKSFGDSGTGYRDGFAGSVGAESPIGASIADTARVASNVGDALTGGYAQRLGSGLSQLANGQGFMEGFRNTPEEAFTPALRAQGAAPIVAEVQTALPSSSRPTGPVGDAFGPQDPNKTTYSPTASGAAPVVADSYQANTLAQMAKRTSGMDLTAADFNKAPVSEETLVGALRDSKGNLMGRDGSGAGGGLLTRQTSAPGVTNLGNYGGDSNIYATASKPGGRLDNFFGVGAKSQGISSAPQDPADVARAALLKSITESASPGAGTQQTRSGFNSSASAINARADAELKRLSSTYSGAGIGNMSKHVAEVERQRNAALANDAQAGLNYRAQDISANNAATNAAQTNRAQGIAALAELDRMQGTQGANYKAQLEAADRAAAAQSRGTQQSAKNYTEAVSKMFQDAPEEERGAKQEQFNSFVAATPNDILMQVANVGSAKELESLEPAPQRAALQALRKLYEIQQVVSENSPTTQTGALRAQGDRRPAAWRDMFDEKGLSAGNYARSWIPKGIGGLGDVQPMENGAVVPWQDLVGDDQDKVKLVDGLRKPRKE